MDDLALLTAGMGEQTGDGAAVKLEQTSNKRKATEDVCLNCGGADHQWRECPTPLQCNCCGSTEHLKALCPEIGNECQLCGRVGHTEAKCGRTNTKRRRTTSNNPADFTEIAGTEIQKQQDGSYTRVVLSNGKAFAPNDVENAKVYIQKQAGKADSAAPAQEATQPTQSKKTKTKKKKKTANATSNNPADFTEIAGTEIQKQQDGSYTRVVLSNGKAFAPNDVENAKVYIQKQAGKADSAADL
jgi:cellular nucleic acid-binding protein